MADPRPTALLLFISLAAAWSVPAPVAQAAPGKPPVVGRSVPPPLPPPTSSVDGAVLYGKYCALCHGAEGQGYAADNAPSLVSATFLATASDDFIRAGVARGRPGTAMAAYSQALGGPLTASQMDAIIGHLRKGMPAPAPLPRTPIVGNIEAGKAVFTAECVRCHGTPSQRGIAVHLANPILLETASDAFLRQAVVEGRPKTPMVPFKNKLGPTRTDDVVAYVRSLAVRPAVPVAPPAPRAKRTGPIVLNPKGKPAQLELEGGRFASLDAVKAALDDRRRIIIVDARAPSDWLNLHITGAISTPYYDPGSLDDIPNDGTWVVAYCACPHHASGAVVDELRRRGYPHTAVLDEGIFAWQHKGYPVVAAPGMLNPPAPPKPPL